MTQGKSYPESVKLFIIIIESSRKLGSLEMAFFIVHLNRVAIASEN